MMEETCTLEKRDARRSRLAARTRGCRSRESGAVALLMVLSMTVLCAMAGLAADIGYLWTTKRHMQTAADAAAIAAAVSLRNGGTYAAAGKDVSSLNGFTDAQAGVTVTVNNPPGSGSFSGNAAYTEVIVSQDVPTWFMRALGFTSITVKARAVGGGTSASGCVYILDSSRSGALHVESGDNLTASCGVLVNSSSSTAVTIGSGGYISTPQFGVVGGYTGTIKDADLDSDSVVISTHIAPLSDPLSYVPAPTVGSCTVTGYSISSGSATLSPGVYCGGMNISGSAVVTLNAGTYILKGGGLALSGSSLLKGTGVTIYNTGTTSTYAPIDVQDSANMQLSAPTSGTYAGILLFNDRSIPYGTGGGANTLGGGSSSKLQGALYFPTVDLQISNGTMLSAAYTIVVAETMSVTNNTFVLSNDYSSLGSGSPIKATVLYE